MSSPTNVTDAPSIRDIALFAIEERLGTFRTSVPAKVVNYYASKSRVDAQICIRGAKQDPDTYELSSEDELPPILVNVPIQWPGTARSSITFDLAFGDDLLIHFSDRPLDEWKSVGGNDFTPADITRRFDISDAFAVPMVGSVPNGLPTSKFLTGATVFAASDIRFGGSDAVDPVALVPNLRTELNAIWAAIFGGHIHPGVVAGPASSGPAVGAPNIQNFSSTVMKGK